MTILEAYKARTGTTLSDEAISGLLIAFGLTPTDEWVYSKDNPINCAFYGLLIQDLKEKNRINSESEGGYSVSYNTDLFKGEAKALANESGCSSLIEQYSGEATITDISDLLNR